MKALDIQIGMKFGRLTVSSLIGKNMRGEFVWDCACSCGGIAFVTSSRLWWGSVASCGCLRRETAAATGRAVLTKHGHAKREYQDASLTYRSWAGMLQRCFNKRSPSYKLYGGRGITVCARWRNSFEAFINDVGERPSAKHTLDRYPNQNGNYEPGNVRWATAKQQCRNTRRNRMITIGGETRCVAEWAEISGIRRHTLERRLRLKWPESQLLSPPARGVPVEERR